MTFVDDGVTIGIHNGKAFPFEIDFEFVEIDDHAFFAIGGRCLGIGVDGFDRHFVIGDVIVILGKEPVAFDFGLINTMVATNHLHQRPGVTFLFTDR